LLLPQVLLGEAQVLTLLHLTLSIRVFLLGLEEISKQSLVEIFVIVDLCITRSVQILSWSTQDAISVLLKPRLFYQTTLALSVGEQTSHLLDDCGVEN
jgi:hypothetical protein